MAKIRFEPNLPVEVALKFADGKRSPTKLRDESGNVRTDVPDEMFYTLCGDDTMYVPLHVADKITALGIRKMELFSICKTVRNKVTKWEVKRVGETTTAALPPTRAANDPDDGPPNNFDGLPTAIDSTPLERQLTTSINQAQQQKVNSSKETPSAAVATVPAPVKAPTQPPNSTQIQHTGYSRMMAAALIAAIDAAREAERYAQAAGIPVKPLNVEFRAEDVRAIAATLFIQASKDPAFLTQPTQKVNGGTTWPQH
jgi:hypothetical protein